MSFGMHNWMLSKRRVEGRSLTRMRDPIPFSKCPWKDDSACAGIVVLAIVVLP